MWVLFFKITGEKEAVESCVHSLDQSRVKKGEEAIIASALSLSKCKTQGECLEYLAFKVLDEG